MMNAQSPRVERRRVVALLVVGLVAPVAIAGIAVSLQIAWLPELPDPAATHWSGTGSPDGFGSPWTFPALTAGVSLLLPLIMLLMLPALRRAAGLFGARALATGAVSLASFIAVSMTMSVAAQRGLEDAAEAGGVGTALAAGLGAALVLGVAGWLVQPHAAVGTAGALSDAGPVEPLPVDAAERVLWISRVQAPWWLWVVALCPLVIIAVLIVAGVLDAPGWSVALMLGAMALVALLLVSLTSFTVVVDRRGLRARSVLGWPRLKADSEDILDVSVVNVSPLGDFGGWGLRVTPRAVGLVAREGSAIEIRRAGGKNLVVTVDDAETAANLLAGLAGTGRA